MLYNMSWDTQTTSKTSSRFVRWLEKQPPDKRYDYCNPVNCPYAKYLRSYGTLALVSPRFYTGFWLGIIPVIWRVPAEINDTLISGHWTFGAALSRARKALVASAHRGVV